MEFIPVCEPTLKGNEEKYVLDAVRSGWISSQGEYITKFENEFARYIGVKHASTCTSGTTALHLALLALGIGPGDEVIIPSFTMIASAYAICYTGATPVVVDCENETWNIDAKKIQTHITDKTKAIMLVPIFGHPCNYEEILGLAKKNKLFTIEDAAEAIGSEYRGKKSGSFCDVSCFSLYGNKTITSGEGGVVVSNDQNIIDQVKYYKNMAFSLKGPRNYCHEKIGYNYRMNNITAALALAQLEKADDYVEMRRNNAFKYIEALKNINAISFQPELKDYKNSYWMFGIFLKPEAKISRDEMMDELKNRGIGTRAFFTPMHLQPCLQEYGIRAEGEFPCSEKLGKSGLYLPSTSHLTEAQLEKVTESIKEILVAH